MSPSAGVAVACAVAVCLACAPAHAEGLWLPTGGATTKTAASYAEKFAVLDSRAATQYDNSIRLTPNGLSLDGGPIRLPTYAGRYKGEYLEPAKIAARRNGVPEDLFVRLVQQESGWNIKAVSHKGATGLAQLMPETADRLGVDETDPLENLDGGARYLRMMYDRFGDWRLALAAYNAGPEAVEKYGGVPPYDETTNYVAAILGG